MDQKTTSATAGCWVLILPLHRYPSPLPHYFVTVISRTRLLSCIGLDGCNVSWCFRDGKHLSLWLLQLSVVEQRNNYKYYL